MMNIMIKTKKIIRIISKNREIDRDIVQFFFRRDFSQIFEQIQKKINQTLNDLHSIFKNFE